MSKRLAIFNSKLVTSILIVFALYCVDSGLKVLELRNLLTVIEASEDTMEYANIGYKSALEGLSTNVDTSLSRIREVSTEAQNRLVIDQIEIEESFVLPWHGQISTFKEAYLEHVAAWLSFYKQSAQADDLEKVRTEVLKASDISTTFRVAERRALDSVPAWFSGDEERRIKEVFRD